MRVGTLMERLAGFDSDLEVQTEGCDCWGDVADVRIVDGVLLLCRHQHNRPQPPVLPSPEDTERERQRLADDADVGIRKSADKHASTWLDAAGISEEML